MADRTDAGRRQTYNLSPAERTIRHDGAALITPDGRRIDLPDKAYEALKHATDALLEGFGVTIAPVPQLLSFSEASSVVEMSIETLRSAAEDGSLVTQEHEGVRRIALSDLLLFDQDNRKQQLDWINAMGQEAHESGEYGATAQPPPPMR
jgi:hypothetical protein